MTRPKTVGHRREEPRVSVVTARLLAVLPWVLSALTITVMWLAGNKNSWAWRLSLFNQLLWAVWIVGTEAWGLLPMNLALWIVYGRNHLKWSRDLPANNTR